MWYWITQFCLFVQVRIVVGEARSYAGMDDDYNARQRYQAFYSLWKNNDISEIEETEIYLGI